jgi:hypothetical protein
MPLKNFDPNKITEWRYSQLGTKQKPQTFEDGHSGTRVDGTRDLILEKFLNSAEESKPNASAYDIEANPPSPQTFVANGYTVTGTRDIISGKFVNDPKTILIGDDTIFEPNKNDTPLNDLTQQQNYTVDNAGGSYQMTGKGAFDTGNLTEIDKLKGLSLIISNWADMVDEGTLISYKIARGGKNATHGHLEIPYSYHNFGATATDAEAFSYGSLSPNIGWTVEMDRGGNATDGVAKDYEKIIESGDMWERFVSKQSEFQTMGEITRGSTSLLGDAPFNSFNSLDYLVAFGSTAQPYRLGNILQGVPRYAEHTPVINNQWYDNITQWHADGDSIGADDDFHSESKMLYLYENFILKDPPEPPSGWLDAGVAFATSFWASFTDPFPIVPSINITKEPSYGTRQGQMIAWTDKNLVYGGTTSEGNQRKYGTSELSGQLITQLQGGKFDFFSSKQLGITADEESVEKSKLEIIAEAGPATANIEQFPSLRQKILGNTDVGAREPLIPKSVATDLGGENKLNKAQWNTRGLVNKYSTLGYSHLGLEANLGSDEAPDYQDITYENTLHSPSEWNDSHGVQGGYTTSEGFGDVVKKGSGNDWKAESGIRKEGQEKVYKIGKQGMSVTTNENELAPLQPVRAHGFRGQVNTDSHGKLFGDHVDQVNALPYGEANPDLDFVPLIFHDVYNNMDIQFRAIFSEDITDTVSPSWNPINYIGRTTAVYTYQNTSRSIGFGFTIFPKTKQEFPILLEKVNYLVGMCYPNLDDYFRASGPLIKLTAGDIVKNQLGFLSECSVTFPSSESPWETDKGLRFTKKIDVSIGFTYIGNNIPVAKGVHYNLDWLDGEHYTEEGVKWVGVLGPDRKKGKDSKIDMPAIVDEFHGGSG